MEILDKIKELHGGLDISYEEDDKTITVHHPKYDFETTISILESEDDAIAEVTKLINYEYIDGKCLIFKDYFEILIESVGTWSEEYDYYPLEIEGESTDKSKVYYKIGGVSDDFDKFLTSTIYLEGFDPEYFSSIKIYNLHSLLGVEFKTDIQKLTEIAYDLARKIAFELSQKLDVKIKLFDVLKNIHQFEFDPSEEDIIEVSKIKKTNIKIKRFDSDLIRYYYRAIHMENSEFKYLAFYQVIECIFDEVYMHETIQDVRRIIDSSWFSSDDDNNVKEIIKIVDKYNKGKNDKNKTKLVLEKYFKGEVHDDAYFVANKEIIAILSDKLKKIKSEIDLNDLQKIANIIYDFRCDCTHSNREYPIKRESEKDEEKLLDYIELIKKISEKIIQNYTKK